MYGTIAGGECGRGSIPPTRSAEALANLYLKSVKNGFSTAYLLITSAVLHAQVLELIYQNIGGLHVIIDKRGGRGIGNSTYRCVSLFSCTGVPLVNLLCKTIT